MMAAVALLMASMTAQPARASPAPSPATGVRAGEASPTFGPVPRPLMPDVMSKAKLRPDASTTPNGATVAPFLTRPYWGPHWVTSIFDHCSPNYAPDGRICEFDGTVAVASSGGDPSFPAGYAITPGGTDYLYYDGHDGWDLGLSYEAVLAAAPGVVGFAGWDSSGFGNTILIGHLNGFTTRYAHLSQVWVGQGQEVGRGQQIGISGSTGRSTGPHLHFGVYQTSPWAALDPWGWTGSGADPWAYEHGDLWLTGNPHDPAPDAPTNVTAAAGIDSIAVSWSAPTFDGGSRISSYTVQSTPGGLSASMSAGQTEVTFGGVTPGIAYTFTVTAVNPAGSSPPSPPSRPVGARPASGPANGYSSVLVNQDGHLEAFYRQADGTVVHSWQPRWGIWHVLGSGPAMQTAPVAGLNVDGRAEAVAVGYEGVVYHTWQPAWPAWTSLAPLPSGVTFAGQPALTRNFDWRLEVFVRGSDGGYWHAWQLFAGGGWSGWSSLGGSFASDPTVAENAGDGHLEVFGRSAAGSVLHTWFSLGQGWSGWYGLGPGTFSSKVTVARNAAGTLEVFALRADGGLSHQWQVSGQGWSGWTDVGGPAGGGGWQGDPAVVANPNGTLEVFLRGPGDAIWHSWQPAWVPYYWLGGVTDSSPLAVQEQLSPTVSLWVHGTGTRQMYEQWRNPDNTWVGWQPRAGSIAVP
jgi:murein DD-endopeptidase MepM/ murein hydrolase activator NlpD